MTTDVAICVIPACLGLRVHGDAVRTDAARRRLRSALALRSADARDAAITLRLRGRDALPAEGYRLRVVPAGVTIEAADRAGLFYGACTFVQWLRLAGSPRPDGGWSLPGLIVDDAPALAHRGVLLDVSRDKVPHLDELLRRIDALAHLKINVLQLYIEHAFAYVGHEVVWRDTSPLTPGDLRTIDAFCRARCITLVPNQNSFGHFHRWLIHAPYRDLAECPDGVAHPFSPEPEPFSLCPLDARAAPLLADLYDQQLAALAPPAPGDRFGSGFNVGLDETLDLGQGRSAAACDARGRDAVYLDFVHVVHRLLADRGRRMQLWADVILQHPARIPDLPRDAIALLWGYEADHPFLDEGMRVRAAGLDFVLCPGTSSWNSVVGRLDNAHGNLVRAARAAQTLGASGLLITDWGDHGHWQPWTVAEPGLVLGAAVAWHPEAYAVAAPPGADDRALPAPPAWLQMVDDHAGDPHRALGPASAGAPLGAWLWRLGTSHRLAQRGPIPLNGTAPFFLLRDVDVAPADHDRLAGLDRDGLGRLIEIVRRAAPADGAANLPPRADAAWIADELRWAADLVAFGATVGQALLAADAGAAPMRALPAAVRRRLVGELDPLIDRHGVLWPRRNRPGGRRDAVAKLLRVRDRLAGDGADRVASARARD